MSAPTKYMTGFYPHKMDAKRRVSIPVELRPASGEQLWLLQSVKEGSTMLQVITREDLEKRLRDIENLKVPGKDEDAPPAIKRKMTGRLHARCRETSINDQGKLSIPMACADAAELPLGKEVALVGRGQCFEIWNIEKYENYEAAQDPDLDAYNDVIDVY